MEYVATNLIPLAIIRDEDRLRPVDPAWVEALAATMEERGLDQAIILRPLDEAEAPYRFALVAGAHRLAAARLLGWEKIRAELRHFDALQARIVEIDENLVRHELTALDRAIFLLERKTVWERLYPETAHGGDRRSRKAKDDKPPAWRLDRAGRFSAEAADRCGFSERTVQRAVELAARLSPNAIRRLRETDLVRNGSALAEIAALEHDDQDHVVSIIAGGDARSVKEARLLAGHAPAGEGDPQEVAFRKLVAAWDRAGKDARRRFLDHASLAAAPGARS